MILEKDDLTCYPNICIVLVHVSSWKTDRSEQVQVYFSCQFYQANVIVKSIIIKSLVNKHLLYANYLPAYNCRGKELILLFHHSPMISFCGSGNIKLSKGDLHLFGIDAVHAVSRRQNPPRGYQGTSTEETATSNSKIHINLYIKKPFLWNYTFQFQPSMDTHQE